MSGDKMKTEFFQYTNIGTRPENQDDGAVRAYEHDAFSAVIADGLGGHKGGREAANIAVKHLMGFWDGKSLPGDERILKAMEAANSEIAAVRETESQMKSTAVALYAAGNRAKWAHIGDSRLYHFYENRLIHFTKDHSVAQIQVQLGEITRDQIPTFPDRSRVLRVLGDSECRPDYSGEIVLEKGLHAFLLCTDGLWERLSDDEIALDYNKSPTPKDWVENLVIRAEKKNFSERDNNTAIAVFAEV